LPQKPPFSCKFALSIGPQRAGTTWIYRYLSSRGDICLPAKVKEIFYFDRNYDRGLEFYKSHFEVTARHKKAMEITATSFDDENAPRRVHETFGDDVTLICPLRHPVIRSYSLYLHYKRYGLVSGGLREACAQEPQILTSSHYAAHLKRWYEYFEPSKIRFVYQEELEKDQGAFVRALCAGLDVDYIEPAEDVKGRYNITAYSKFSPLARAAQHGADFLREYRLYFLINIAKAIGLKRLIFGAEKPDASKKTIPDSDRAWLFEQLEGQVQAFEALSGERVSYWAEIEGNKDNV